MSLIERLQQADGPSRELDAEIVLALGIVRERDGNCFYGHRDYSVMVLERGYCDHEGNAPELPRYTASLDAAMSLVPDGYGRSLHIPSRPDPDNLPSARVWGPLAQTVEASAATPALALTLCIAALSAQEASNA